jgi:hypothetical protein
LKKNIIFGFTVWVCIMIFAVLVIFLTNHARAESDKINICHATESEKNPYVSITIDASSINNEKNKYFNGHGDHEKDIIPPFSYEILSFEGKNWDEAGKSIWSNGCNIVDPTPTPTPTSTPTPTPTSTPTSTPTITPTTTPTPISTPEPTNNPTQSPTSNPSPADANTQQPEKPHDTITTEDSVNLPDSIVPEDVSRPETIPVPTSIPAGGGGTIKISSLK